MKIAVMQPYFFPYIGYWQLINHVDVFVVFDDVNYKTRGWINRNRICPRKNKYINLPLVAASQNKKIKDIQINRELLATGRNSKILHETYRKAPFYEDIRPLVEEWMNIEPDSLSEYLKNQICAVSEKLNIKTDFLLSSEIDKSGCKNGEEKIIRICKYLGATEYVNPVGGINLYNKDNFAKNGITLKFLKPDLTPYKQYKEEFIPALSIVDVLMFCGVEETVKMLNDYSICG